MGVDDTGGFVVKLPGGICAGYEVMDQALDGALEGALDLEIAAFNGIRCVVALGYRIPCRRPMSALLGCHWQWRLWSRVARGVVPMAEQGSHSAGGGFNTGTCSTH